MKKAIILLIFVVQNAFSQNDSLPKLILKATPSYLFDFDNTFSIGAEKFISSKRSIQLEGGYGNSNQNLWMDIENGSTNNRYKNFDIVRLKSELRFYTKKNTKKRPQGFYYAIEAMYKYVGKNDYNQVGRKSINFTPEYWEYVIVRQKRTVFGSHFKIGTQFFMTNSNQKPNWIVDIYGGIGARQINNQLSYDSKQEDDRVDNLIRGSFGKIYDNIGKITVVSATFGFKIGYIIY